MYQKFDQFCTGNFDLDNASRSEQPVEVDDDTSQTIKIIKITHVI